MGLDAMGSPAIRTDLLYIAGLGRSGTTVVSQLLDQVPGVTSVGEGRSVWRAAAEGWLCGCGVPFHDCKFWTAVGGVAGHRWDATVVTTTMRLDRNLARHRDLATVLASEIGLMKRPGLAEY